MMNEILNNIKNFYNTNQTKQTDFRINQLKKLKNAIKKFEPEIVQALRDDLRKPDFEIYTTELYTILHETDFAIKHLKHWAKPERAGLPIHLRPAKGRVVKEPYGIVLIIVPFNYPFQLTFVPLVGAIAAGNCCVIRPSARTPNCANIIYKIINETFSSDYINCILPKEISSEDLLKEKYDYIFFTGSTNTGKIIAETAAKTLTPYTLELGGKSPVIVDKTANISFTAKKIAWGKFLNCGQTCIAPDYILVNSEIKEELISEIILSIKEFYGVIPQESKDYGRIIDDRAFAKLQELINKENQKIIYGGSTDECGLFIEPTILDIRTYDTPAMEEEIFGPILPILSYEDINEVIIRLKEKPKPLGLYLFTQDKALEKRIIKELSFGGGAVNDIINHAVSPAMPFGGIGHSGTGQYHGKYSFDTFSHLKSILIRRNTIELLSLYPPYKFEILQKLREQLKLKN